MYINFRFSKQGAFRLASTIFIIYQALNLLQKYTDFSEIMIITFGFFFLLWQIFSISESFSSDPITYDKRSEEEKEIEIIEERKKNILAAQNNLLMQYTEGNINCVTFREKVETLEMLRINPILSLPQKTNSNEV